MRREVLILLVSLFATAVHSAAYVDDPSILASEIEGQALINQLNALLSSASTAKAATFNRAANGAPGTPGTASRPGGLSSSSSRRLAPSRRLPACIQFTGKTCCKVRLPPKIVSQVRMRYDSRFCRFDDCNGSRRHSTRAARRYDCLYKRRLPESDCYRTEVTYASVPQAQICPAGRETCCAGSIWYQHGCISLSDVRRWITWLQSGNSGSPPCHVISSTPQPTPRPTPRPTRRPTPRPRPPYWDDCFTGYRNNRERHRMQSCQ